MNILRQSYAKNPKFWFNVVSNLREWKNVANDAIGMLKFVNEKGR